MPLAHQLLDVLLSGLIAGLGTFIISLVAPTQALALGLFLAAMYYFSRNPWGSPDGERYNEQVDALYDRLLPGR